MDYEKLGAFYLGKEWNPGLNTLTNHLTMYDARDLTTHAVCIGMTGSGKTGLCIDLLEEAALDRVPSIIIDPKGDITNLLLQFPELRPEDFKPWINSDDARRKGMSIDEYSKKQADLWKNGLAQWGQDPARISRLKESAEFNIYTPGSDAGLPVSVLHSFNAPIDWYANEEESRDRIQATVSGILGLLGKDSDPVRSKDHILLSNLFEHFWKNDENLDFQKLILSIQDPPIQRLGVFDVDTFMPEKDRFDLAMQLNNILASPSFASWLKGRPLEIGELQANETGKPCSSIFYLAHLNEAERMFFVTMLLNQVISWMRSLPGTTSLRTIIYMDEIFGFLPPVSNPPSKRPLLTLLKQARAYGVGLLLATQNPVDLDYKALTNTGTWFIGRLQTERDKNRLLEGLASASSESGETLDRKELSDLISGLGKRVFLLHNVHENSPVLFQTRWAMSYLRGPLTRRQISTLTKESKEKSSESSREVVAAQAQQEIQDSISTAPTPPILGPGIEQVYLSVTRSLQIALAESEDTRAIKTEKSSLVYRPGVFAKGNVHFIDRKRGVDQQESYAFLAETPFGVADIDWKREENIQNPKLMSHPHPEACYEPIPDGLDSKSSISKAKKDFSDYLYRSSVLKILHSPALNEYSEPKESEKDFRMRLTQSAREARDDEVDQLNALYDKRLRKIKDRLVRAETALEKKQATSQSRNHEFLVSVGESLLGMFLGRRSTRSASSALGKYRMKSSAKLSTEDAEEKVEALEGEVESLQNELQKKVETITEKWEQVLEEFEEIPITPRRVDIEIDLVTIGWKPYWKISGKDSNGLKVEKILTA